eukprot:1139891-Pelagomonas_calceolata.AAC.6
MGMELSCKLGRPSQSHPHPGGLCGECSRQLEVVCTIHCVVAVRLLARHQASQISSIFNFDQVSMAVLGVQFMKLPDWIGHCLAGSDQDSIRAAGVASSLIRSTWVMLSQAVFMYKV